MGTGFTSATVRNSSLGRDTEGGIPTVPAVPAVPGSMLGSVLGSRRWYRDRVRHVRRGTGVVAVKGNALKLYLAGRGILLSSLAGRRRGEPAKGAARRERASNPWAPARVAPHKLYYPRVYLIQHTKSTLPPNGRRIGWPRRQRKTCD